MRYVALLSSGMSAEQVETLWEVTLRRLQAVGQWTVAFDAPGITVLVCEPASTIDRLYALPDRAGIVFGKLFERRYEGGSVPSEAAVFSWKRQPCAKYLLENFWGAFIAFLRSTDSSGCMVLRDPSGSRQCFFADYAGVHVFFSRLADFEIVSSSRPPVDWSYVRTRIAFGALPAQRTGLVGVNQLMPGECFVRSAQSTRRALQWDLARVIDEKPVLDRAPARTLLRSSVRACVHAWASCYENVFLLLSGGLDSAIVLSCLKDAPGSTSVTALNFHSSGADSDERRYARLAAEGAGIELVELRRDPAASWRELFNLRRVPEPYAAIGTLQTLRQLSKLAKGSYTAQFSGDGGDLLFYRHAAFLAAADFMRRYPVHVALGRHILSAAYLDRSSVWRVLAQALYYGMFRATYSVIQPPTVVRALLGPSLLERLRDIEPPPDPVREAVRRAPTGKQYQVACLFYALCSLEDPLDVPGKVPEVAPLLSQPLIEAILRIPLFLLISEGRDRSLARSAFSGEIPAPIEKRQSKGGLEDYARESLLNNLALIKELLFDGHLVRQGLLDRRKLVEVLAREPSQIPAHVTEIYDYANVEAWLRSVV